MKFDLPIISANMDYVTEYEMAHVMTEENAFYVIHRFMPIDRLMDMLVPYLMHFGDKARVSISVGVRNPEEEIHRVKTLGAFGKDIWNKLTVTVDVAHGHHRRVVDMIKRLRDMGVQRIIAGNVATVEGYKFLANADADAIKVGIGPGSVCTTREVAGVGIPQIGALMDITAFRSRHEWRSPVARWLPSSANRPPDDPYHWPDVIADGGMKSSGDIVKALAAGADMVMLGSLLAGTREAPGERRTDTDGTVWKRYRGQSIFGVNASHYTPEGIDGWVKENGPVADVLQTLGAGIRSGMSYVGARNLKELREKAEFVQITQAGYLIESATRVMADG
jgi:IMP dehydrogenase